MSEKEGDLSENQHYKLVCWSIITAVTRMQWGIMQDGHVYCNIKMRREHWMTNLNILLVLISNPAPTISYFELGLLPTQIFFIPVSNLKIIRHDATFLNQLFSLKYIG